MKRYLSLIILLFTIIAMTFCQTPYTYASDQQSSALSGATSKPDHITLTWVSDPKTTQTITWRTDKTINKGFVQYAKDEETSSFQSKAQTIEANTVSFTSDIGDFNIHTVTLINLEPGTRYYYRVGDGNNWSNIYSFSTEPEMVESFKFLVFGDTQSGDASNPEYLPWAKTAQNAFSNNPDAKFFINVGDLVERGQSYIHWNKWFDAVGSFISNYTIMPVEGNHETYNPPDGHTSKPIYFIQQFFLPQNGPDNLKGQTYSFDYGNVHIAVLDSQADEEGQDILQEQAAWLEKDLQSTDKRWKLVFFHKTPYYLKATRTNEYIKSIFSPIFDKYHVDIVFNGHDHGIARTYPIKNDTFVSSPADGTIYYVTGRSGNKYYTDLSQKVWDAFFYDPQDQPTYLVVNVNGDKLTISAFKQDNTPIDIYTIDKSSNSDYPKTVIPPKYNITRLAIYGNLIQQPLLQSSPMLIDGKWYIPLRTFVEYIGGEIYWNNSIITITYQKDKLYIYKDKKAVFNQKNIDLSNQFSIQKGVSYISCDTIKELWGFSYKYDENTNILFITR